MQLESLKRWHWIVIGLLLGLMLGGMRVYWGPDFDQYKDLELQRVQFDTDLLNGPPTTETLSHIDRRFGRGLRRMPGFFDSMVVHPPVRDAPDGNWVTGVFHRKPDLTADGKIEIPGYKFLYRAPAPYVPKPNYLLQPAPGLVADPKFDDTKAAEQFPTIKEYLDLLKAKYPTANLPYAFAWYEVPRMVLLLWTGGTLLLVGGVWPVVLSLLTGAGFGLAQREEDEPMRPYKPSPKRVVKPSLELTASDLDRLRQLEAELEAKILSGSNVEGPAAQGEASRRPVVRPLTPLPLDAQPKPPEKPAPVKTFGAEGADYYPTEIHGGPQK